MHLVTQAGQDLFTQHRDIIVDAFCFLRDLRDAGEDMRYILGEDYAYYESFFAHLTPQMLASLPIRPRQLDSPSRHIFALQLLRHISSQHVEQLTDQQQPPSHQPPAVQSTEQQLVPSELVVSPAVQSVEQQPVAQPLAAQQQLTTSIVEHLDQRQQQQHGTINNSHQATQQSASASSLRSLAPKPAPPHQSTCRHLVARPLQSIIARVVTNQQQRRHHRHHHPPWPRLVSSTADCSADWRAAHRPAPDPIRDKSLSLIVVLSC